MPRKKPTEAVCQLLAREIDQDSIFRLDYSVKQNYISTMTLKRDHNYEPWLQQIKQAFGGKVNYWKGFWYWSSSSKKLFKALEKALPYVKKKRAHVELMLEFGKNCTYAVKVGVTLDPKEHEYRRELIARMKRLNGEPAWSVN